MKEVTCSTSEHPTGSPKTAPNDAATSAATGGISTNSASSERDNKSASASAAASKSATPRLVVDGWICDDANPFGHTVCREIRQANGEWPAALILSVGDGPEDAATTVEVPGGALRWLLTGEVPT